MTNKEKLELLNLRNRVSNQREEIKRLNEIIEMLKAEVRGDAENEI